MIDAAWASKLKMPFAYRYTHETFSRTFYSLYCKQMLSHFLLSNQVFSVLFLFLYSSKMYLFEGGGEGASMEGIRVEEVLIPQKYSFSFLLLFF